MKSSKLRTGSRRTIKRVLLTLTLSIFMPASLLMAQSVAEAAKAERERREQMKEHGKAFTEGDLKSISERSNVSTGTVGKGINTPPHGTVAIPVRRAGSAMIVSAELNNRLKANLVVDTGASYIGISEAVAATLGLTTTERTRFIPLQTTNGIRMSPIMKLSVLHLGSIEMKDIEATVIEDWSESDVVGLLGMNFLSAFDWSIDNTNGQLLLKRLVDVYGGYGKDWWIERFHTLHSSIDGLKAQLKMDENRGDANRTAQTKEVLNRFQAEMDLLTRGADEAGLPLQYRN